ncbi:adult-specific rigid cuticular protein 15.7-like [Argiope bruennichi]|uniref:Adult-specific rigid cuticular protein 15.5 like protein n=1 Tax=Argiope bruennichi TaxID=94029 RepID=A0A8T0EK38_ARGBR|nr:adult-specific rigid cuticular protein 15.7-like [Argiope bruennichi]KAF8773891.1 Adult-specific rigid cuticular protein 15.5 like protein [Argiope bruennichi]
MLTKTALICSIIAAVHATGVFVNTGGVSTTTRRQSSDGSYGFSYEIVDANGASNSRMEIGDAHGNKQGNYHLIDTDGRARRVDYIADKGGFRAVVKTNEPGTARSAPAGVVIDSPYQGPVAPEVPVVVAQPPAHPAPPVVQEPVAIPPPVVQEPVAVPVVQEPIAVPAPVVQQPVAVPAPVVVQPVAHPVPVSTVFTVRHTVPAAQRPLIPTRGIVVNHGLYNFGGISYSNGIVGFNPLKGYPLIR